MPFIWNYARTQGGTTLHKFWVARNIAAWIWSDWSTGGFVFSDRPAGREWLELIWRALRHDLSKYRWSEAQAFAATIDRLRTTKYDSPGYKDLLATIKPAIDLHYKRNRHHPEHWPNGIADMTHIDRIEMIADWGAAVRRHEDEGKTNAQKLDSSISANAKRFRYDEDTEAELRVFAMRMGLLAD